MGSTKQGGGVKKTGGGWKKKGGGLKKHGALINLSGLSGAYKKEAKSEIVQDTRGYTIRRTPFPIK